MKKIVLIDGNSIANRAFYGIMGTKTLMTSDGKYTNAVYGFLAILFKILDDIKPEYMCVAFDLKAPTARHKLYDGYKANRKPMPEELAYQMPEIKEVLRAMNIDIVEKEGYEADDVLGTLSRYGEKQGLEVTILSGDRDTFQLATDNVIIRIPRTKMGKTEIEDFDRKKIKETYGITPKQLIEVKGLQGDSSDNIPGVPGIGEKTALSLIQKYGTIQKLYEKLDKQEDDLKGKQREKLVANKDLADLSRTLGEINLEVPIEDTLENFKTEEWDKAKVLEIFNRLKFNRYIDRFNLKGESAPKKELKDVIKIEDVKINDLISFVNEKKEMILDIQTKYDENSTQIIKEKIISLSVFDKNSNISYYLNLKEDELKQLKAVFESSEIKKVGENLSKLYILLKQSGITLDGIQYDTQVAAYILNPTNKKLDIENLAIEYLDFSISEYLESQNIKDENEQINLFEKLDSNKKLDEKSKYLSSIKSYCISNVKEKTQEKLKQISAMDLFDNIDMPTIEVLSQMQWNGMLVDESELTAFGEKLQSQLDILTKIIYEMAGEEFNINSTKQLGQILFEKMKLPVKKKTKNGYSTDVDVLEKLKKEDPIIEQILEYRQLMKLNSTYVEGLKPYINPQTKRIHSFFHQTITATGRISSTEPNLQNIPTRFELGKQVRKIFEPEEGNVYIDADYSQIELRVLAHISEDSNMIEAFKNDEDIHKQAASKVFKTPIDQVTHTQRSNAKAVNFGIVYGISDYRIIRTTWNFCKAC